MEPSELLTVLTNLPSSSSGTGISYYSEPCPRRARLRREDPCPTTSYEASVGVVFHKLMELYYGGKLKEMVLPLGDNEEKDPIQEALRLFTVYSRFYPADEWTVIVNEAKLPYAGDMAMQSQINELMGVPFTLRPDLVVKIDAAQAEMMLKTRKVDLLPGYYIVDHKTHDKKNQSRGMEYSLKDQFATYQIAINVALRPVLGEETRGVLVNDIVRHKNLTTESFSTFFIPPPSEQQVEGIRRYLTWKAHHLQTDVCERTACFSFNRACEYFLSGACNRV